MWEYNHLWLEKINWEKELIIVAVKFIKIKIVIKINLFTWNLINVNLFAVNHFWDKITCISQNPFLSASVTIENWTILKKIWKKKSSVKKYNKSFRRIILEYISDSNFLDLFDVTKIKWEYDCAHKHSIA